MDLVEFTQRVELHPAIGTWSVVDVSVNGTRLQEKVRAALLPLATTEGTPELAGNYMGLDPVEVGGTCADDSTTWAVLSSGPAGTPLERDG